MRILKSRSGHTLLEAVLVSGVMGFIGAGAVAVILSSATCLDNTTTEAFTDTDAVIAMQKIVGEVREANEFKLIANGERLRVIYPKIKNGYYDRSDPDMANQIDYYLSDETGVPGHEGNWLWRGKNNNDRQVLKKGVSEISFEPDTDSGNRVKITIVTENESSTGTKRTELTQRVVYLRNN